MKDILTLAKEIKAQDHYCSWKSLDQTAVNFKEHNVPIALIFTVNHSLSPIKLHSVLETYHRLACLLPEDSNQLYAVVSHLSKNPKLYFGKVHNIRKLHRSFDAISEPSADGGESGNGTCYLIQKTITMISDWLPKAFFFEKVIKHIILINGHSEQCPVSEHFHGIYFKDSKLHRWFVNQIVLNATKMHQLHYYDLLRGKDSEKLLKNGKEQNILEGIQLILSHDIGQARQGQS
ncbi:unnamed protein product [Thelazia callipaeda]|uniref:AbiV family abortive infection protein n=1 Tax=Thelazia callipaeda TaxID=103827 RepID=A0A0N5CSL7_THECL|nr:unnamed protein product [Thelazia callipaeda]